MATQNIVPKKVSTLLDAEQHSFPTPHDSSKEMVLRIGPFLLQDTIFFNGFKNWQPLRIIAFCPFKNDCFYKCKNAFPA